MDGSTGTGGVLVVGPSWVGDMVLSQGLYRTLKAQAPERPVTVLAPPFALPLTAFMPEVDHAIPLPFGHGEARLLARWRLGRALRRQGFTWAIVLPGAFKAAIPPWAAGIERRTGWHGEARWGLLNDRHRLDPDRLPRTIDRFVALALPPEATLEQNPEPALRVPHTAAEQALAALRLALPRRPLLALCPGAEYGPAKRWPVEHFAAIAKAHIARSGEAWIFGGARDRPLGSSLQAAAGRDVIDLTGRTDLTQAVALLSLADAVVSNDSGLMHVAAALGRRLIALFGPSDERRTPPLSSAASVLSLELPCRPCRQRYCPLGHQRCLRELPPARVLAALDLH